MTCPAEGMSTPTPSAMSGSTPIVTDSVVPIAKPPRASATIAATTRTVLIGAGSVIGAVGGAAVGAVALTQSAKGTGVRDIPGPARRSTGA